MPVPVVGVLWLSEEHLETRASFFGQFNTEAGQLYDKSTLAWFARNLGRPKRLLWEAANVHPAPCYCMSACSV